MKNGDKSSKPNNPLSEPTPTEGRANLAYGDLPKGTAKHIVKVQPATGFEYRYTSSTGMERVIHLERGALEPIGGSPEEVFAFRATVSPIGKPTRGGFFTTPDSIPLRAEAFILIEEGVPGDSIICRSLGSFAGLRVTLEIFRQDSTGTQRILKEEIQDADEHTFLIR